MPQACTALNSDDAFQLSTTAWPKIRAELDRVGEEQNQSAVYDAVAHYSRPPADDPS